MSWERVFELAVVPTIGIRAGLDGGALVVAGGVMASSDDCAASSRGRVSART